MKNRAGATEQLSLELLNGHQKTGELKKSAHQPSRRSQESDHTAYRLIVENALQGITIYQNGRIVFANRAIAELLGYTVEELLALSPEKVTDLVHQDDQAFVEKQITARLANQEASPSYETRMVRKDGSIRYVQLAATLIQYRGQPAIQTSIVDITERVQAEEALYELHFAVNNEMRGIAYLDLEGKYLRVNDAYAEMLGYKPQELVTKSWKQTVFEEDLPSAMAALELMMETGSAEFEARAVHKNGSSFHKQVLLVAARDRHGNLIGYHCFMRDISERIRAEEKLLEHEMRFRSLIENSYDVIMLSKRDGTIKYVSPAIQTVLGYAPEELLGQPTSMLIHPNDIEAAEKMFATALDAPGKTIQFTRRLRHCDGSYRTVEGTTCNLLAEPSVRGMLWNFRDITERKQAEMQLQYQANVLQQVSEAIISTDMEFNILSWNEAAVRLYGWKEEEVLGKLLRGVLETEFGEGVREKALRELMNTGSWSGEVIQKHKDGTRLNIHLTVSLIYDDNNNPDGAVVVNHDITERKRSEEALRASEKRFRELFESSPYAIFVHDLEGNLLDVNQAACRLHKTDYQRLMKMNVRDLVPPEKSEAVYAHFQEVFKLGSGCSEGVCRAADGSDIPCEIRAQRFFYANKPALLVHVHDISERKRLETQLLHAQKLEAIGRLAGGVAHDFNNLLTVILGSADFALQQNALDETVRAELMNIKKAANQASSFTNRLLTFSRSQIHKPRVLNLNELIEDQVSLLNHIIGEDVELKMHLDMELASIFGDPAQIQQVLMNVCVNSRDAMPSGGKLTVETRNIPPDEDLFLEGTGMEQPLNLKDVPGDFVEIAISDTGKGMDEQTLSRIFEPFFTTKEVGKGTGLGLSVVYGIIKQHGGYTRVESKPDRGTTLKIYLPAVRAKKETEPEITTVEAKMFGKETILLVEDEESVLRVGQRILTGFGYEVVTATNGYEATTLLQEKAERIDLVVLDVVMPKLSGPETYKHMRLIKPQLPVIFVTGYDAKAELVGLDIPNTMPMAILQKPYTKDTLGQKIREVLEIKHQSTPGFLG